jgi:hypothetical protein
LRLLRCWQCIAITLVLRALEISLPHNLCLSTDVGKSKTANSTPKAQPNILPLSQTRKNRLPLDEKKGDFQTRFWYNREKLKERKSPDGYYTTTKSFFVEKC